MVWKSIAEDHMQHKKRNLLAALCALALVAGFGTTGATAAEPTQAGQVVTDMVHMTDGFFETVGFLQFHYQPWENYIYNEKYAFQWLFGFNKAYDDLAFVANCYADTVRCKFNYDGKDWLIQFWKGSYGIFLATGGEIGAYNKPETLPGEHFFAAKKTDWIRMEMAIYNKGNLIFTRPMDDHWWCTGYAPGYLEGFGKKPRTNCMMMAKVQLKDAQMASQLAKALQDKGFMPLNQDPSVDTPDSFFLKGDTVAMCWKNITESWY
jgi:hypothetical protein